MTWSELSAAAHKVRHCSNVLQYAANGHEGPSLLGGR